MRQTLLLVDDNPEILSFLSDDLGEKYDVITAFNGEEAIHLLAKAAVNLIIADIMMPVMNGFDLCRYIKTSPMHCHLPLILLTARNTLMSKIEGLEIGADAYIDKPFSPEYLQVQVANLLMNRSKINEHFEKAVPMTRRAVLPWPSIHASQQNRLTQAPPSTVDETQFMKRLEQVINKNLHNPELDVEHIASLMHMSKPTLYRKLKLSASLGINELINACRLKEAASLLLEGSLKIYEIADSVGYRSQTQFGRNFLKVYGITPTEYMVKMRSGWAEANN